MSEFIIEPEPVKLSSAQTGVTSPGAEEHGLAITIPGWRHVYSGKVRELYIPDDSLPGFWQDKGGVRKDIVLVVASDRISAFDHILPSTIPDKGEILTRMTTWWLDQLGHLATDHRLSASDPASVVPVEVAGRAMVCHRLDMFPIECVVRGYLTGTGLVDYQRHGAVCGVNLPGGLSDGSRLPSPIFTPARKMAVGDHDENIDFDAMIMDIGEQDAAELREITLAVYSFAERIAHEQGIILADTKLEFGTIPGIEELNRTIVLGDEVLTPDSSRFWDAGTWHPGGSQPSFDKQYVRDWLTSPESRWDRNEDRPPPLPGRVIEVTRARYLEAYERLTGLAF